MRVQRRNFAGLSEVLPLAGRCSDHRKCISPLVRASRQYLALPRWLLFRAEKKSDPVMEIVGVWPIRTLGPIPALRRLGKHAS
jgi:hypothetical protein